MTQKIYKYQLTLPAGNDLIVTGIDTVIGEGGTLTFRHQIQDPNSGQFVIVNALTMAPGTWRACAMYPMPALEDAHVPEELSKALGS